MPGIGGKTPCASTYSPTLLASRPMACFDNQKSMKARAASGCGALDVMAMARAVPSKGWPDCGHHASGAGALVSLYLGMEMPMGFSPLLQGAGVGAIVATNVGRFAARPMGRAPGE